MCFVAYGNRKIIKKIKVDRDKLEQIARILELDVNILPKESKGKLVGIELLFEDESGGQGGGSSSSDKAR